MEGFLICFASDQRFEEPLSSKCVSLKRKNKHHRLEDDLISKNVAPEGEAVTLGTANGIQVKNEGKRMKVMCNVM